MGRQPWIVQGLLLTSKANSPSVSTTWLGISLGVFISLYLLLGVVDFWLMRRYATLDSPELERDDAGVTPMPVSGY
jgi:cytochrome d ubiquinol oxidase subunit I